MLEGETGKKKVILNKKKNILILFGDQQCRLHIDSSASI